MQSEASWCLLNIAGGNSHHVKVIVDHGVIEKFVQLLESPHNEVIEHGIQGLGNIAGDQHWMTELVLLAGALENLTVILSEGKLNTPL